MSWSGSGEIPAGKTHEEIDNLVAETPVTGNMECVKERQRQINAAALAVAGIVASGAVGDHQERAFNYSISGHASQGHSSFDQVSVNITQKQPVPQ